MATNDVPGANAVNNDVLKAGCWAEHEDGSLILVKGTEPNIVGDTVVYEMYDTHVDPVQVWNDAMRKDAFESQFSWNPKNTNKTVPNIKWTWHDKTPFPWSRVMKAYSRPVPIHAEVSEQLSAAAKVADALKLRAKALREADLAANTDVVEKKGKSILDRIARAVEAFSE